MQRCVRVSIAAFGCMLLAPALGHAAISIATTADPPVASLGPGVVLTDTATVTGRGGPEPGATIDFRLYGPDDTTCSDPPAYEELGVLYPATGSPPVPTPVGFPPQEPGVYRWRATYDDPNNAPVTGPCSDPDERTIVNKAVTTLTTNASPFPRGTLGQTMLTDSATVSGRFNPQAGATIDFKLYGPDKPNCNGDPLFEQLNVPYPVTGPPDPVVTTPAGFPPTVAGTYKWEVSYSGDDNNASDDADCDDATERTIVDKAIPTLATTATPPVATLAPGLQLTDAVTVNGRVSPTATADVDFRLYGPSDLGCTGPPVFEDLNVPYPQANSQVVSAPFPATDAGTYRWKVTYSGDANNAEVTSPCSEDNQTIVTKATPTFAYHPSPTITVADGTLTDAVTVLGRAFPKPGGTIVFKLFGPGNPTCTGTAVFQTAPVSVPAAGEPVVSSVAGHVPVTAGTYQWQVVYSGDANNVAVTTCAPANSTLVEKAKPTISTDASDDVALGGAPLTDQATVNVGFNPRGSVDFKIYGPADPTCINPLDTYNVLYTSPGDPVTSPPFTPHDPGIYRWIATYNGDGNNETATGTCDDAQEFTVVDRAQPTIDTDASPDIVLGTGTLTDEATVSGQFEAKANGTIDFELYGPDNPTCTGQPSFTSSKPYPTQGATVTSDPFVPTRAGTYRWIARYSGDANNKPVAGLCNSANESTVIFKATPQLTTTAVPGAVPLGGGTVTASTKVTGRASPEASATVEFRLHAPDDPTCTKAPVFTSTNVPVPAAGDPTVSSGAFTPVKAGTHRWTAHYSGDENNASVDNACGGAGQNVAVAGVTPTLTTTASPNVVIGGSVSVTATLTGRVNPADGALIDFELYGPDDVGCSRPPAFRSLDVPYPAVGGAVRSAAFTPSQAGTYRWIASYSGDGNNESVAGGCNAAGATQAVLRATPSLATSPSPTFTLGTGSMTDTVTVNGRVSPVEGGVVDFRAYAPSDTTCSRAAVFQSLGLAYPVAGGPVTSAAFTPTRAGTYRWIASYRGDGNNAPVVSACDTSNATVVAPGRASQRVPNRAQTRKVTAKTTPKRDRTKLYTFTTTGRVQPPPYCAPTANPRSVGADCVLPICPADSIDPADCAQPSRALLCSTGKMTIRFVRIAYTVSSRSVGIRRDCTYRSRVSFKSSIPIRKGALTVQVRFEGNSFLLPKRAPRHIVRAG